MIWCLLSFSFHFIGSPAGVADRVEGSREGRSGTAGQKIPQLREEEELQVRHRRRLMLRHLIRKVRLDSFFPIFLFKLLSAGFRAPSPGGSPLGKKGAKAEKKSENPSFRRIDPVERTGRMADHRICFHQTSAILILAPGRSAGWCADALHVSALHQSPSFAVDVTGGPLSAK